MDSSIVNLQEETFGGYVKTNDCLVVFHKPKCPICKVLLKVMEKCKLNYPEIQMACINSEENEIIIEHLEVSRVPSILVYKQGELLVRKSGIMKPAELAELYLEA